MKLMGKLAVVTGGASGIGNAIANRYAAEGARIVIVDADAERAVAAADVIVRAGGSAFHRVADVTDKNSVAECVSGILAMAGAIDILVNSAGVATTAPFLETPVELFDKLYAVNLRGTFLFSQSIARAMVDSGTPGSIVNISSVSGSRGNAGRAAYGASKAGVNLLTAIMAVELGAHGIRTNAIAPGPVDTPMIAREHSAAIREAWLNELPVRRYGTTDEIAAAALFLASSEAGFVNGHILNVDGGFMAGGILAL